MSNPSNELFEIIRSLTPQEKTFFKAYFLKAKEEAGTPSFLLLFDSMNELEVFDKHQLKQILTKKGFRSNYFKAQTYLTEAILNALTKYHSETENTIKLGYLIQQINILIKKNLFRTAQKYFERAQKMADANTMYEYQLLLDYLGFHFHEKKQAWMDKYMGWVNENLKIFGLETELRRAGFDALQLSIEHFDKHVPENEIRRSVIRTLDSLDHISKNLDLNNFSKSRFYNARMQCLMILQRTGELGLVIREYAKYLRSLPGTNSFFARTALHGYNAIIIAQAHMRNFGSIETTFSWAEKYFHSIPSKICTPDISSMYYSYILENMLAIFNETGQPEKTLSLWNENKKEILLYNKKNSVSLYTMNVALGEFMLGNFHQAVRLANTIPFESVRPTVHCEAKLLLLLAHYELGNIDILPSLARHAKRAYEKCGILTEADIILFTFFERTVAKLDTRQEKTKAFTELNIKLVAWNERSEKDPPTGSINVQLWVESKIKDRPYSELVGLASGD